MTAPDEAGVRQLVFQDECDAHAAAMKWFEPILEAQIAQVDDVMLLEFDEPRAGVDGRVMVLYRETEHVAVAAIWRDTMNWSRLITWSQSELADLRLRAETAEARLREPPTEAEIEACAQAIYEAVGPMEQPWHLLNGLWKEESRTEAKAALIAFLAARAP